ncbi:MULTISPECIES: adenylyl-sulfate kinase [Photobacterium]|uniref:Adenylyl-sulfate kinase n=1 Tax=Photobacterium halotolerans TaxID=265726 RepID=A0A0F5V7I1_9GAMM|nr:MULTISPECIES: adenylyl-sulfate kinase [Photobacterium]KKC98073.1 adenylylsulfate kinase [Photobacterium halotolerans]UIP27654.1 adenylyl-sulfate kinase [Photobacterium sp. TLY01]
MTAVVQPHENENVVWHNHQTDKAHRAQLKNQSPCVLWFTGLSGAGKSTVAGALENRLAEQGFHTYLLDGDNVRHGLCKDLGFSAEDRKENIRRIGEVAKLMADAGLIVLTAFISPHRAERQLVRELLPEGEFIEVFVDTPLAECEKRDPKGLYKKARAGEIKDFTGIDSEYQPPANPEIHLQAGNASVDELVTLCVEALKQRHII